LYNPKEDSSFRIVSIELFLERFVCGLIFS
jgi:hypothetical protein